MTVCSPSCRYEAAEGLEALKWRTLKWLLPCQRPGPYDHQDQLPGASRGCKAHATYIIREPLPDVVLRLGMRVDVQRLWTGQAR